MFVMNRKLNVSVRRKELFKFFIVKLCASYVFIANLNYIVKLIEANGGTELVFRVTEGEEKYRQATYNGYYFDGKLLQNYISRLM